MHACVLSRLPTSLCTMLTCICMYMYVHTFIFPQEQCVSKLTLFSPHKCRWYPQSGFGLNMGNLLIIVQEKVGLEHSVSVSVSVSSALISLVVNYQEVTGDTRMCILSSELSCTPDRHYSNKISLYTIMLHGLLKMFIPN